SPKRPSRLAEYSRARTSRLPDFECWKTEIPAPLFLLLRSNLVAARFRHTNRPTFNAASVWRAHLSHCGRHCMGIEKRIKQSCPTLCKPYNKGGDFYGR